MLHQSTPAIDFSWTNRLWLRLYLCPLSLSLALCERATRAPTHKLVPLFQNCPWDTPGRDQPNYPPNWMCGVWRHSLASLGNHSALSNIPTRWRHPSDSVLSCARAEMWLRTCGPGNLGSSTRWSNPLVVQCPTPSTQRATNSAPNLAASWISTLPPLNWNGGKLAVVSHNHSNTGVDAQISQAVVYRNLTGVYIWNSPGALCMRDHTLVRIYGFAFTFRGSFVRPFLTSTHTHTLLRGSHVRCWLPWTPR